MKSIFPMLLFLMSLPAHALRLQSIDINDWNATYTRVVPRINVDCDCSLVLNPDGTTSILFSRFSSIRKVGNDITCVVGSPADFLQATGAGMSLLNALLMGGGASWTSYDNGVTWWRIMPGSKYPEAPDSWCLQ